MTLTGLKSGVIKWIGPMALAVALMKRAKCLLAVYLLSQQEA